MARWVWVACIMVLALTMLASYSDLGTRRANLQREMDIQNAELLRAGERIAQLEAQLEAADDEVRMRALAQNRLGMQVPTQRQVERIPVPFVIEKEGAQLPAEMQEKTKGFSLLELVQTIFDR